jgi:ApaG protein
MSDTKPKEGADEAGVRSARGRAPNTYTSETTTRGIRVHVESAYLSDRSSPRDNQYLFAYHVRISNIGAETAQLVSREWIITNADGEVERVKGPGVVGEQPVIAPGGVFEYTSYCPLKTTVGTMQGSYQMVTADGEKFDAQIVPFTLAVPNALN